MANTTGDFPDKSIFERWIECHDQLKFVTKEKGVPTPKELEELVSKDRSNTPEEWPICQRNFRLILFLNQGQFIKKWFPDYDPTIFVREEDKPYDWDHILAQAGSYSEYNNGEHSRKYRAILNSIGDLRVWPSGENRRDGNSDLNDKIGLMKKNKDPLPNTSPLRHKPCSFKTFGEITAESCISNLEMWLRAYRKVKLPLLERAVLVRAINLYRFVYDKYKFREYRNSTTIS